MSDRRVLERVLEALSRDGLTPFRYRRLGWLRTGRIRAAINVLRGKPTISGVTFYAEIRPDGSNGLLVANCTFEGAETGIAVRDLTPPG